MYWCLVTLVNKMVLIVKLTNLSRLLPSGHLLTGHSPVHPDSEVGGRRKHSGDTWSPYTAVDEVSKLMLPDGKVSI